MNKLEVAQLLTVASGVDNRNVSAEVVEVWFPIVGSLNYSDALDAMKLHFTESTDWMLPAHIVRNVHRLRESRIPPRREITAYECHHMFKGGWCVLCPTEDPEWTTT